MSRSCTSVTMTISCQGRLIWLSRRRAAEPVDVEDVEDVEEAEELEEALDAARERTSVEDEGEEFRMEETERRDCLCGWVLGLRSSMLGQDLL